jgi:hypothetical protein
VQILRTYPYRKAGYSFAPDGEAGSPRHFGRRGYGRQMATEVRETEKKYESEPGAALPGLDDLPQVARETSMAEQRLDADYYDTADLRLVRAGVTLRRRRGGSDQGVAPEAAAQW